MAQAPDPYAAGVAQAAKDRRQRRHDEFMERVQKLSYAVGCKVVPLESAWAAVFYSYFAQATALGPSQPNLTREEMSNALTKGPDVAAEKGCDFWKNNPDAVLEVRQSVSNRRMP